LLGRLVRLNVETVSSSSLAGDTLDAVGRFMVSSGGDVQAL
jgi:hypothetical protein